MQERGAPCVPAGPYIVQRGDEAALTQTTRRCGSLLDRRRWRGQRHSFPRRRAGGESFILFRRWLKGQRYPLYQVRAIPFPPSFQVHGLTVCDALPPHSHPRPILPAAKRVRFGDAVLPHAPLASPYRDSGSSARMSQNAGPSVPSSLTPIRCTTAGTPIVPLEPLARRLEAWLALPSPSRWLTRTIRLGYAIQFARRPPKFSGVLETAVAARNAPVLREEIAVLLARMQSSGSLQPRWSRGFTALISSYPRKTVVFDQSWIATPETGPCTGSRLRCWRTGAWSMHTAPGLVCSDWPEGCLLSCFDPSTTQTVLRFASEGRAWQYRVLPFGLSLSARVFTKIAEGALAPLREVGIRILNCLEHGPHAITVMRSQGPGASAPQPVGASGQLGKEQALPCAENLFSRCGVRLGEYDGPPHGRARPVSAELPEFLRRQDCGPTETVSEAPGAYGIRSRGHAARIASYETTSALVTLPSPEVGIAPRCTSGEHHTGVSPLLQPLDRPCLSTGRGALRTSVSACCCHNRCLQLGLGRYMQRAGSLGALDGASTALARQLPRAAGSASSLAAVSATAVRQACVGPYGQHCGGVVYQPDGGYTITPHVTARPPSPPLESHAAQIAARCPHSGGAQSCGRRALTTAHFPRRMATPSRDDPAVLESIRRSSGRPVCFSRVLPLPVVFPWPRAPSARTHWHTAGLGLYASMHSPSEPARTDTVQSQGGRGAGLLVAPFWPTRTWFPETHSPRDSPSLAHSSEEGLPFSGARHHWHPCPDLWNLHVWLLDGTRQTWVVSHRRW